MFKNLYDFGKLAKKFLSAVDPSSSKWLLCLLFDASFFLQNT